MFAVYYQPDPNTLIEEGRWTDRKDAESALASWQALGSPDRYFLVIVDPNRVPAPVVRCDFCSTEYTVIDRFDDSTNACVNCAAEVQAEIERTEARFGKYTDESPFGLEEAYTYSPDRY